VRGNKGKKEEEHRTGALGTQREERRMKTIYHEQT
jgi:hypothetical protein